MVKTRLLFPGACDDGAEAPLGLGVQGAWWETGRAADGVGAVQHTRKKCRILLEDLSLRISGSFQASPCWKFQRYTRKLTSSEVIDISGSEASGLALEEGPPPSTPPIPPVLPVPADVRFQHLSHQEDQTQRLSAAAALLVAVFHRPP